MSYIGNPIVSTDFPVDYKSGNGSTTAFTLSIAPASVNSIDVQISGVSQSPQTYSVSGTTLTFSAAPPTGTNNIVIRHLGVAGIPNTPSAGSVVPSSIGTGYSLWNLSGSNVYYTAGNVGIGTASPSQKLQVTGTDQNSFIGVKAQNNNGYLGIAGVEFSSDSTYTKAAIGLLRQSANGRGVLAFYNSTSTSAANWTTADEKMRIDESGNLLVGTTNTNATTEEGFRWFNSAGAKYQVFTRSANPPLTLIRLASDGQIQQFFRDATQVGSITVTTSATAYNTSSDYRLKENVAPMQNALNVVQQLKPVTYKWKADGSDGQGFIAHELQAVVPDCVTGEKDAIDEEGKPVYQGIDTSFLVATLTAAIQELKAELDATKAEVAALKAGA